jgi:hypothetical protein
MLRTNEMLLGLLLGVQAVAASSAGVPAMSKSTANEYLSKGKTCVGPAPCSCQALKLKPLLQKLTTMTLTVCCPETRTPQEGLPP